MTRDSSLMHRLADDLLTFIEQREAEQIAYGIYDVTVTGATERGVVVTASTSAGKTYAFFLPILAKIVLERCLRDTIGVKAICIYPRVALSENQLTDLIEILFYRNQMLEHHDLPPVTIGAVQRMSRTASAMALHLWYLYTIMTPMWACGLHRSRLWMEVQKEIR